MARRARKIPAEALGILLAVLGAILLLLVLRYDPARGTAPPFLVILTGWTAPWVATSLFVTGAVVALHGRAGYWSAEALDWSGGTAAGTDDRQLRGGQ